MRGILEKMFETGCMRAFITVLAQVGRHHIEAAREQRHVGIGRGGLQHLVAGQHQFADQVHHAVEQRHVDAQRAFSGGSAAA